MIVDEYVQQIVPYFLDEEHDVLKPLETSVYGELIHLIDQAISEHPNKCAFWFWRGWTLQFFSGLSGSLHTQHPEFELIEDAYKRVLELDSNRNEAYFMLAYLYWDSAKRAKAIPAAGQPDAPESELDPEIAGFNEARQQWELFKENDGLGMMIAVDWALYPFQARAWSELLKRMLDDVVAPEDLMEVYLSWGFHWMDCDYGADNSSKRKAAYEQARWAFARGAALADDKYTYGMKLDCRYWCARLQSAKYGGDPITGLKAWVAYVELAHECGRKYWPGRPLAPYYEGNNTAYSEDDIQKFWNENPLLESRDEPLAIILQLEALGALDLSKPGNAKLKWYLGRRYSLGQEWGKAEHYLAAAQRELPAEQELVTQLALALRKQSKTKECAAVLQQLGGDTETEQLLRLLGVDIATASDLDAVLAEVRQLGTKPDAPTRKPIDVLAKCAVDLHGVWPLLPTALQRLIVDAESMQLALEQNPLPNYDSLIVQWGKVAENLLRVAVLAPFAHYLNKTGYGSNILIKCRTESGKFRPESIGRPPGNQSWVNRFDTLNPREAAGILYAARDSGDKHVFYQFLTVLKLKPEQIAAWLNLAPDQVDAIRERRNEAAHGKQCYILSDALDVRSILFSGGLIAQMGVLLKHTEIWRVG